MPGQRKEVCQVAKRGQEMGNGKGNGLRSGAESIGVRGEALYSC